MLVAPSLGRTHVARDPDGSAGAPCIGRVLAKTSIAFMIFAAADVVATYADLPHRAAHLVDIVFIIAFALQGAIWGRELILGTDRPPGRGGEWRGRARQRDGDHPRAGQRRIVRDRR